MLDFLSNFLYINIKSTTGWILIFLLTSQFLHEGCESLTLNLFLIVGICTGTLLSILIEIDHNELGLILNFIDTISHLLHLSDISTSFIEGLADHLIDSRILRNLLGLYFLKHCIYLVLDLLILLLKSLGFFDEINAFVGILSNLEIIDRATDNFKTSLCCSSGCFKLTLTGLLLPVLLLKLCNLVCSGLQLTLHLKDIALRFNHEGCQLLSGTGDITFNVAFAELDNLASLHVFFLLLGTHKLVLHDFKLSSKLSQVAFVVKVIVRLPSEGTSVIIRLRRHHHHLLAEHNSSISHTGT